VFLYSNVRVCAVLVLEERHDFNIGLACQDPILFVILNLCALFP
jgi:hypothetical protein